MTSNLLTSLKNPKKLLKQGNHLMVRLQTQAKQY